MLAIVGASGKLGLATLSALIDHNLIPATEILCTTSSTSGQEKLAPFRSKGVKIASADWDDPDSFVSAFAGCEKLFLISSSRIQKDFRDAPPGHGREADHFTALKAAAEAGVKHVYYTSLAFARPTRSGVMKAHERTEEWLESHAAELGLKFTILREGLYNESWPLYFGHWDVAGGDERDQAVVAGDGRISWTSIPDLGMANALILAARAEDWEGRMVYLSQSKTHSLEEVAEMVGRAKGRYILLRVLTRDEHERFYIEKREMNEGQVKWWAKTYDALEAGECEIQDPTLERLLESKRMKPKQLEDTIREMLSA